MLNDLFSFSFRSVFLLFMSDKKKKNMTCVISSEMPDQGKLVLLTSVNISFVQTFIERSVFFFTKKRFYEKKNAQKQIL